MELLANEIRKIGSVGEFNAVSLLKKLVIAAEFHFESAREELELLAENIDRITNSNSSNPRGRKPKKRIRFSGERMSINQKRRACSTVTQSTQLTVDARQKEPDVAKGHTTDSIFDGSIGHWPRK